jgi:ketosteroid isomerase-like protein
VIRVSPAPLLLAPLAGLILMSPSPAATTDPPEYAAFDSLVAAERAFAALSAEKGMKTAFLAHLASDGILFRPHAVNGRSVWESRPEPPATLLWEPSFAEVAGSGDFGWTTGPWELRSAGNPTGHGHFLSVWKRAGDGSWRVALDIGISHEKPARGVGAGVVDAGPAHARPKRQPRTGLGLFGGFFNRGVGVGVGVHGGAPYPREVEMALAHQLNTLLATERTYAFQLRTRGAAAAWEKLAANDARFYREGARPGIGRDAGVPWIAERLAAIEWKKGGAIEWKTGGSGIAPSADLGYVYGVRVARATSGAAPDTSSFVHVWRKDARDRWTLAADVENEYPKR